MWGVTLDVEFIFRVKLSVSALKLKLCFRAETRPLRKAFTERGMKHVLADSSTTTCRSSMLDS